MNHDTANMLSRLRDLLRAHAATPQDMTWEDDAAALRKISMTLQRWHELECGDSNSYASWAIERGKVVKPVWHEFNQWTSTGRVIYVPYRRFLTCTSTRPTLASDNGRDEKALDAYFLRQPDGSLQAGLRHGSQPNDYISPQVTDAKLADELATEYSDDGPPFMVRHHYSFGAGADSVTRTPIADREAGAKRRLARIMARYPALSAYIQTDPRGCALYILKPGDVPESEHVSAYYSRGLAVFK